MPSTRLQLIPSNITRNSGRGKDSWGVNVVIEGSLARKRFGLVNHTTGTAPGQGLLLYGTVVVSIRNDVLYVGASSFSL